MQHDSAFQMSASNIRFGPGITTEVGMDLKDMGVQRTLVVMDPALRNMSVGETVIRSLESERVNFEVFQRVVVEPTDQSFQEAAEFASAGRFDSFVAVGGGSTIDTAKAANLYATYPADFFTYVNAPIGKGQPVPGPLKPLIAIPTTAGTGSETTGVAIFDLVQQQAKTGIAHRYMKPTLGIIDPDNTRQLPPAVAASSGLDVLSHALESYTAIPFNSRPKPQRPLERPAYQGTNPISDIWALRALEIVNQYLIQAVQHPEDDEARGQMLLAAAIAGIGFGNAGVHLPHGMSYPVAGMVRDFKPDGYQVNKPLVPHGMSVILNAPAVFRFTGPASPERHLRAARALGAETQHANEGEAGQILSERIIHFMRALQMPNGLSQVGYQASDISPLVQGTLPQHRVTKLSPLPAGEAELTELFHQSLSIW